jgi:hypothetical protein
MSAIFLSQVSMAIKGKCHPILPSGEASTPQVFVGPCQVNMIKDKYYAWVILLSQVSMAIGGECLFGVSQNINTPSQ